MAAQGIRSVKLMQLNMWGGRLTAAIVKLVAEEKPDIITAQELFTPAEPVIFPDRMFDCLASVRSGGGYEHVFASPTWSLMVGHQNIGFGNVIFSKFPLRNTETTFTNGHFVENMSERSRIVNIRNVQTATVDIDGKQISLVNHQGHWEPTPIGSETSVEKMQLVKDIVAGLAGPYIVAGDLNVSAASPAMRPWDGFLEDLTATHDVTDTLSRFGKVRDVPCDHILVGPEIKVTSFKVCDELVSDHKALIMEFET
jgi:endonuclease/exonuclease/phosphatase (EEP) superfamily protein YafD